MEFSTATHKVNRNESKSMVPFLRWKYPKDKSQFAIHYAGENVIPEILLIAVLIASASIWHIGTSAISIILLLLWSAIVTFLFTLSIANIRTGMLPNKFVYPMGLTIVVYQFINAIHLGSVAVLVSAALGGLLLGGLPYLLFQVSAGRWIGGGDVKVGFYAGLLLGWKLSIFTIILVALLVCLFYLVFKFTRIKGPERFTTGTAWTVVIVMCMLLGQNYIK
jgi:leader peptidase (prepilin peptidase)/N-methyltransferase